MVTETVIAEIKVLLQTHLPGLLLAEQLAQLFTTRSLFVYVVNLEALAVVSQQDK